MLNNALDTCCSNNSKYTYTYNMSKKNILSKINTISVILFGIVFWKEQNHSSNHMFRCEIY